MLHKPEPFVVDPANPFANDKLDRNATIENLTQVATTIQSPAVSATVNPKVFAAE